MESISHLYDKTKKISPGLNLSTSKPVNRTTNSIRNTLSTLLPIILIAGCSTQTNEYQNIQNNTGNELQDASTADESIPDAPTDNINDTNQPDSPTLIEASNCLIYEPGQLGSPKWLKVSAIDSEEYVETSTISGVFSPTIGKVNSNSWTSNNASFVLSSDDNAKYPLVFTVGGRNAIQVELDGTSTVFEVDKTILADILDNIECEENDSECEDVQLMLETPNYEAAPYGLTLWSLYHTANIAKCANELPNGENCHLYTVTAPNTLQDLFIPTTQTESFNDYFPNQTKIYMGLNDCKREE